ncbi:putative 60S acidic ribosomal protein [Hyphopichia burtonii NRRL Y-1933]|uniref:Putative 60S acidic ribosomal protein n=1 Tax=Hyphopichia burtonii NRRL Y-1933 TaxID=984485 RepID=A0A1E4RQH5_9ASCO|nr:putative 60S acidic ribosomal protein [Hyphopichia burtonii NRRL Y-1933]ODV69517.1 putative 60S acidic ribosomal protein [Hyphopichia burtonii NRRL Y-1933]
MSIETSLSYAALILADSDIEISAEKLAQLTSKANVEVESIWTDIYAKALEGKDLKELFFNITAAPAAGAGAAAGGAAAAEGEAAAAEEKKEEEAKEESDDDMGFGLFD